jgi:hypothetical protein
MIRPLSGAAFFVDGSVKLFANPFNPDYEASLLNFRIKGFQPIPL